MSYIEQDFEDAINRRKAKISSLCDGIWNKLFDLKEILGPDDPKQEQLSQCLKIIQKIDKE